MWLNFNEFVDEFLLLSLPGIALSSLLSSIDVVSDYVTGLILYADPKLRIYGIITLGINWVPGVIASIHLISSRGKELGTRKTLLWCCKFKAIDFFCPAKVYRAEKQL